MGDLLYHGPRNPLPDGYDTVAVTKMLNAVKDKIVAVRGNCDFYAYFGDAPAQKLETLYLSGYKISATHGDLYGAKYGLGGLIKLGLDTGADIVLFGHTHLPLEKYVSDYERPMYLFNPGSICSGSRSFGIMDLREKPFFSHGNVI